MTIEAAPQKPGAFIPQLAQEYGLSETLLYGLANQDRLTFERWLSEGTGQ